MEKTCKKCERALPLTNYFPDKKARDGLQGWCKTCKSAAITEYYKGAGRGKRQRFESSETNRKRSLRRYRKNRVSYNFSRRMRKSLGNGGKGNKPWETLVNYTLDDLKKHLESKFQDGMSWDNYGKVWHIDHILPVSSFNITSCDCEGFKQCWRLENLQPLSVADNLRKSNKLPV